MTFLGKKSNLKYYGVFLMGNSVLQHMLCDVTDELLEKARAAKSDAQRSGSDYDKGRHFALYEVISLLVQQAEVFGIDKRGIGLNNVDVERDFFGTG